MIRMICPKCRKPLQVADTAAGQTGKCAYCGTTMQVPQTILLQPAGAQAARQPSQRLARSVHTLLTLLVLILVLPIVLCVGVAYLGALGPGHDMPPPAATIAIPTPSPAAAAPDAPEGARVAD